MIVKPSRFFAMCCVLVVGVSIDTLGRPKSSVFEIKTLPNKVKALATIVEREKGGDFRTQAVWALETRLREQGVVLAEPDAVDALLDEMLQRMVSDMSSSSDVYKNEGDDAPRADFIDAETALVFPGRNSSTFSKTYTARPVGKRLTRALYNKDCKLKVTVAKSAGEWFQHVETKGWGIAIDPVLVNDAVARVVVRLFSKGEGQVAFSRHERPVWVAFFKQEVDGGPWLPVLWNPVQAKLQRDQETTLLPVDPKAKPTDAIKQHVLSVRFGDLAFINPARSTLHETELKWTTLNGLSGTVVEAKNVAWLEPYRRSEGPLVRAAAILKGTGLGVSASSDELLDVISSVKHARVQAEALLILGKQLDASNDIPSDEDRLTLTKAGGPGVVSVWKNAARLKTDTSMKLYRRAGSTWQLVEPLQ